MEPGTNQLGIHQTKDTIGRLESNPHATKAFVFIRFHPCPRVAPELSEGGSVAKKIRVHSPVAPEPLAKAERNSRKTSWFCPLVSSSPAITQKPFQAFPAYSGRGDSPFRVPCSGFRVGQSCLVVFSRRRESSVKLDQAKSTRGVGLQNSRLAGAWHPAAWPAETGQNTCCLQTFVCLVYWAFPAVPEGKRPLIALM